MRSFDGTDWKWSSKDGGSSSLFEERVSSTHPTRKKIDIIDSVGDTKAAMVCLISFMKTTLSCIFSNLFFHMAHVSGFHRRWKSTTIKEYHSAIGIWQKIALPRENQTLFPFFWKRSCRMTNSGVWPATAAHKDKCFLRNSPGHRRQTIHVPL